MSDSENYIYISVYLKSLIEYFDNVKMTNVMQQKILFEIMNMNTFLKGLERKIYYSL